MKGGWRLIPVVLASLVLGAHVLRTGWLVLAIALAAAPLLLLVRRAWAARALQVLLAVGALEWVRTLAVLADERMALGRPWARMAVILGAVAVLSAAGAVALEGLARRWRAGRQDAAA